MSLKRKNKLLLLLPALMLCAFTVEEKLPDAHQEQAAQKLFHELRCVVCQGESLSESNADMAVDMRKLVRKKIAEGKTAEDIKTELVTNYGEQILQTPPKDSGTYLLWYLPLILLVFGVIKIIKRARK